MRKLNSPALTSLLIVLLFFSGLKGAAQVLIAGWDFQTTTNGGTATIAAPSTPTTYIANVGSGNLFLNGVNGSGSWAQATELGAFAGTALNAGVGMSTATSSPSALALLGGTSNAANGKSLVFQFNMSGYKDLVVSYATQKTSTGFDTQTWQYSTNGTTWTSLEVVSSIPSAFAIKTLATTSVLDNVTTAYIRLTVTGATAASGNNRLDNFQLAATPLTPTSTSLSPSSAFAGGSDFVLTVNGTNFISGLSNITWNGSSRTTTFVNATQLTASISASDIASAATIPVGITTTGAAASSNTQNFSVINANAPTKLFISSINGGGNIVTDAPFTVTVQAQDAFNSPSAVSTATDFSLSLATGNGALGGTVTGTIASGATSVTVSGVTYNTSEAGVSLVATRTSGDALTSETSATFTVYAREPIAQPTSLVRTAVTPTGVTLGWTAAMGSPTGYIIFRTTSSGTTYPDTAPVDGTVYTVGNFLGNATIEYIGNSLSAAIASTLNAATQYSYAVYSYNGSGSSINYYTTSPLQGQFYTLSAEPTVETGAMTFSSLSATGYTINFSGGNGMGRLVVVRPAGAVDFVPADGVTYAANTVFTGGMDLGPSSDNKIVYASTGNSVAINGLTAGTVYYIAVYEYNGSNSTINYLATAGTGSRTTLAATPSTAASAATFVSRTSTSISINWTVGNGAGRIVVARPTNVATVVAASGTAYTVNTLGSFTGPGNSTTGINNVVVYDGTGTSLTITNLSPKTAYSFFVYEYNGSAASTAYASAVSLTSQYTLADEPTNHAALFAATTVNSSTINLAFSAASTLSADGYLLLKKTSAFTGADYPADGLAYSVGATVGGATVNTVITANSTTVATGTSVTADATYNYLLVPFNWDGTNSATRNYYTGGSIPVASATTPSAASTLGAVVNSESTTISSLVNAVAPLTASTGVQVWQFTINDGGGSLNDADNLPTKISSFTLTANVSSTVASWSTSIKTVALFDGTTFVATGIVSSGTTNTIVFSGLSLVIPDGTSKTYRLRLSLNNTLGTTDDGKKFVFNLTPANIITLSDGTSSDFVASGSVNSSTTANVIDVTAALYVFGQQPTDVQTYTSITPSVTVKATDTNGNLDLGYTGTVLLTASGATLTNGLGSVGAAAGIATFPTLQFSTTGSATLTASGNITAVTSNSFIVTLGPGSYTYRTLRSGDWASITSGSEVWQRSSDGTNYTMVTQSGDLPNNSSGAITISHAITSGVIRTIDQLTITNGGNLTCSAALTIENGNGDDLTIQNGGVLTMDGIASPTISTGAVLRVATGGLLTTNTNSGITGYAASAKYVFENGAILEYSGSNTPSLNSVTFFPDVDATTIPVLRFSGNIGSAIGGSGSIVINGIFEVDGSVIMNTSGTRVFRNGIRGSGSLTQSGTANSFQITGTTAEMGGGTLTLASGGSLTISSATIASLISAKTVNAGTITVNGTLNMGTYALSGSANLMVSSTGTIKTASLNAGGALNGNFTSSGALTLNTGSTVEFNGAAAQFVAARTFSNLTINNPNDVTANGAVTVNGTLNLVSGIFNNSTNNVTLSNGANIVRSGGTLLMAPTFPASVNVSYTGTGDVATGVELPINNTTVNNLILNRTLGKVILSAPLQVNGMLTFASGSLELGVNNLTLAATSSLSGSSRISHVITNGAGGVKLLQLATTSLQLFPIGSADSSYSPVTVANPTILTDWTVRVASGIAASNPQKALQRTWNISRTAASGDADVAISYDLTDNDMLSGVSGAWNGTGPAILNHFNITTNAWDATYSGSTTGGSIRTLSVTGVTAFSPFGISGSGTALPVSLLTFSGKKEAVGNILKWTTANESNNRGFTVERSVNGIAYAAIGFTGSHANGGNSNSLLDYSFADASAPAKAWYRLQQVDFDGKQKQSVTILIKNVAIGALTLTAVSPNLVRTGVVVGIEAPQRAALTLTIVDGFGRTVIVKAINIESGNNAISLDLSKLAAGAYYLRAGAADGSMTEAVKLVKQ